MALSYELWPGVPHAEQRYGCRPAAIVMNTHGMTQNPQVKNETRKWRMWFGISRRPRRAAWHVGQ